MDLYKTFKHSVVEFDRPHSVPPDVQEVIVNSYGGTRAVNDKGIIIVQTKKLKGVKREVLRINTLTTPPTIELAIEESPD